MMKLVTAFAIAAALSLPALAKEQQKISPQAAAAQASAPGPSGPMTYGYSPSDPTVVIVDGELVGRDPSPDIRSNLRRDPKSIGQ